MRLGVNLKRITQARRPGPKLTLTDFCFGGNRDESNVHRIFWKKITVVQRPASIVLCRQKRKRKFCALRELRFPSYIFIEF